MYGRNLCARSPLLVTSRKRRRHRRVRPCATGSQAKKGSGSDVRLKRGARPHILSSSNQRWQQRCRLVDKCGGQALHPIHPVLAYRRYWCRLSLPAYRRAACAGAAWEYRVYDGARENSGPVRQGLICHPQARRGSICFKIFLNAGECVHKASFLSAIRANGLRRRDANRYRVCSG